MRKTFITLMLLFATSSSWSLGYEIFKGVDLLIPLSDTNMVYLYDLVGKESVIGAETPILRFRNVKNLTISAGVLTDGAGFNDGTLRERERATYKSGTPFLGFHIPIKMESEYVNIGAFVSRNLEEGKNIAGIKASLKLW